VLEHLKRLPVTKQQYYRSRKMVPDCPVERAVRFLYLNRTAFAGMYRLNREGHFNVPYGGGDRTTAPLFANGLLEKASVALQGVVLTVCDFETAIDSAGRSDLLYCDPTYTVAHENNGFVRYNERNFSWSDQIRLASACFRAAKRGATVIVSNAWHPSIRRLYRGARAEKVQRMSLVSRMATGRRAVHEYLFVIAP
jgi:DNA adenine methylase